MRPIDNRTSTQAAVALFLYDRPGATRAVFAAIRAARPARLFLIADGPQDRPGAGERVAAARAEVASVDWPCRVERLYAETNLGCDARLVSGIGAVFAAVESAIFLEDDCLPQAGCIAWLARMLKRWRDDPRVMMVSAANPLEEWRADRQSFHFAWHGDAWGWATWRRAWTSFSPASPDRDDPAMRARLARVLPDGDMQARHLAGLAAAHHGRRSAWDTLWEHARLMQGGLAVVPARNMIDNLGFGHDATNTRRATPIEAVRRSYPAPDEDHPPEAVAADPAYERLAWELRAGRHSAAGLVLWGGRMVERGRAIQALALAHGGLRQYPGDAGLVALAARAAAALGR